MDFYTENYENDLDKYDLIESLTFEGVCKNNIFFNEDTGYGVYNFECENGDYFRIQGCFIEELISGCSYKISGKIKIYNDERQFNVTNFQIITPKNKKGIISYLQTLYGLQTRADDIYEKFGENSIEILLKDPMQVTCIAGIGKKSVEKWSEQLEVLKNNQSEVMTLLSFGLTQKQALKLIKANNYLIIEEIIKNPYLLMDKVDNFNFLTCDKAALELGLFPDNKNRIMQGLIYVLKKSKENGNVFLYCSDLIVKTQELLKLELNRQDMLQILEQQLSPIKQYNNYYNIDLNDLNNCYMSGQLSYSYFILNSKDFHNIIKYMVDNNYIVKEEERIYLKDLFFAEYNTSKHLKRLAVYNKKYRRKDIEILVDEICKMEGFELEKNQREACIEFNLYDSGVYILTGSAGTGKTFTINLILKISELLKENESTTQKLNILPVAPTGKAAKVMTNSINKQAFTIHKALGCSGEKFFAHGELTPFYENYFICDETSMIDIELMNSFLSAIPNNKKVIFVGDIKQLESVGPGNVLKDMIKSNKFKMVELNVAKRQSENSGIIFNANKVIDKEPIISTPKTKDFFILNGKTTTEIQSYAVNSVKNLINQGYSFDNIQILIPQRTGIVGVNYINLLIQKFFNPIKSSEQKVLKGKYEINGKQYSMYFHQGDKVMHIKNNYDLQWYESFVGQYIPIPDKVGITNGEAGIIQEITKAPSGKIRIIVKYDDGFIFYDEGTEELELSYAITIHKSQGSAWEAVILFIVSPHIYSLTNNLIYTGLTRARNFCCIIGDNDTILKAIKTVKEIKRNTTLSERICEMFEKEV